MDLRDKIKNTLSIIPKNPGIYIFKDVKGNIIYVGKAKNLSDRVKSYFAGNAVQGFVSHPISFFRDKIDSIDFMVTDNEIEALVLESNLIKKNHPKYNVFLKDDKSYPYVVITEGERFPRVFITRNRNIKDARYYGPYTNVKGLKETISFLKKTFLIRDCSKPEPGKRKDHACLNYHINMCSAPCIGKISEDRYRKNIDYIKLFLKAKDKKILTDLNKEMSELSSKERFEEAAEVRERIDSISNILTDQKIFFTGDPDTWDILAVFRDPDAGIAAVSLYNYRSGELAASSNFLISNTGLQGEEEIMSGFIKNYYSEIDNIGSVLYIPFQIQDIRLIASWLSDTKGKKIDIKIPKKGNKKKLLEMAQKNAKLYLEKKKFEKGSGYSRVFKELTELKRLLGLQKIPRRMECYDISNIGPSFAVGSMVVFADGSPLKSNYRHFKINTVSGQDDFAMMAEIVSRRLRYLEKSTINIENSFYIKPDLIIIDGGRAQLNAVKNVISGKKIMDIDVISIAKKEEKIFCDQYPGGIKADISSRNTRIILKIRDEAHRFAVKYHRKLHEKYMTNSILDGIKGIGEKKKRIILARYSSLEELRSCKMEDLLNIRGLSYRDALNIFNTFNRY